MSDCRTFDTVMSNKKKNATIDAEEENRADGSSFPYLPEDFVLENVVTKLPTQDLSRFTTVSKLWYNSILNDKHYQTIRTFRNLSFNLLNVAKDGHADMIRNYFFSLRKDGIDSGTHFYNFEYVMEVHSLGSIEPVGNCNGLTCFKRPSSGGFEEIFFVDPAESERLIITCLTPEIEGGGGTLAYLCHGFGFDSLSQEYKVVVIYTTKTAGGEGFICMVVTLGVRSWRKIVISTSEISPPPGYSTFPSRMVTSIRKNVDKSATICGCDLLWRVTNTRDGGDEIEMLLSFDIHNEKIQFIRLPTKCNSLIPQAKEDGCLEIGHHLLEYKEYPCVACSEKILITKRGPHLDATFCCYRFKVHLYILKDKFKQIWKEEKTFDVRMREDSVVQDPFYVYFCSNTNGSAQPTRIFSFSDQVILYWFDGGCLIFYNLQTKYHNVVESAVCNEQNREIFDAKVKGIAAELEPGMVEDDEFSCPCIDYQLHAQVENIISLKTFVPEEGEFDDYDSYEEFQQFVADTGRKTAIWYTSY